MIVNKQKAREIVIRNFKLMNDIKLISDNFVVSHSQPIERYTFDSNSFDPRIIKPNLDSLLQFSGKEANGQFLPNIDNPAVNNNSNIVNRYPNGDITLDYSIYKESILPLIFITKIVAEWADETLDLQGNKKISVDAHNNFKLGALFDQVTGGAWKPKNNLAPLIEFILIRNAFTHRGNILEFEQKSNLEILEAFGDILPITKLQKSSNLVDIPYSKYIELFNSVINSSV
jgi:hypothetical protein